MREQFTANSLQLTVAELSTVYCLLSTVAEGRRA